MLVHCVIDCFIRQLRCLRKVLHWLSMEGIFSLKLTSTDFFFIPGERLSSSEVTILRVVCLAILYDLLFHFYSHQNVIYDVQSSD